jgi:hypothetical protein
MKSILDVVKQKERDIQQKQREIQQRESDLDTLRARRCGCSLTMPEAPRRAP